MSLSTGKRGYPHPENGQYKMRGNTKSRYVDQFSILSKDSYGNQTMVYEEKVKLFNAKRYLMLLRPLGTKNWTIRDYIRFIDQVGRWCPKDKHKGIEPYQDNR